MPPDPREAELIAVTASVLTSLVVAVERVDHAEIASQIGRLLNGVTAYNAAMAERPGDKALRRAVAALSRVGP